ELSVVVADAAPRGLVMDHTCAQRDHLVAAAADLAFRVTVGVDLESWLAATNTRTGHHEYAPDDVAMLVYTSGTSGHPKGVVVSHANLDAKVSRVGRIWDLGSSSKSLLATPLFHIGALSWGLVTLHAGAELVLAEDGHAETLLRHLSEDEISH